MKKLLTFVTCMLLLNGAFASGNANDVIMMQISGKVTDSYSDEELTGVEVRIKGTDIVTYTDFDGHFTLAAVPSGNYTLEFRFITYTREEIIHDDADHQLYLDVALTPSH